MDPGHVSSSIPRAPVRIYAQKRCIPGNKADCDATLMRSDRPDLPLDYYCTELPPASIIRPPPLLRPKLCPRLLLARCATAPSKDPALSLRCFDQRLPGLYSDLVMQIKVISDFLILGPVGLGFFVSFPPELCIFLSCPRCYLSISSEALRNH